MPYIRDRRVGNTVCELEQRVIPSQTVEEYTVVRSSSWNGRVDDGFQVSARKIPRICSSTQDHLRLHHHSVNATIAGTHLETEERLPQR